MMRCWLLAAICAGAWAQTPAPAIEELEPTAAELIVPSEPAPPPMPGAPGEPFPLWLEGAPGAKGKSSADTPTLTAHLPAPESNTGAAIVVCPGGGYGGLAMDHEGAQIAAWLNANGITAFILQYRHAPGYAHPAPLMDARRAVRIARAYAAGWGVDPARIGMIGFSAGGHLAATAGTQFEPGDPAAADAVDRESSRPDFLVLMYPVITMNDPYAHAGSRKNLLGDRRDPLLFDALSADQRVTKDTPPAFLVHTTADEAVPAMNAVLFYSALVKAGVPAELHIFEQGRHGLGLAADDPAMRAWPDACLAWLRVRGILR